MSLPEWASTQINNFAVMDHIHIVASRKFTHHALLAPAVTSFSLPYRGKFRFPAMIGLMATDTHRATRRLPVIVLLAAAVLAIDQATKFWAESALTDHAPVPLLGDFLQFRLIYNSGAAFSIGSGSTWLFTVAAAVAVVVLAGLARRVRSRGQLVAVGLLLGGATTHLLDRLFRAPGFGRGHVVDFIDYNGWFIGNVADIALTLGAAILVLVSVFAPNEAPTVSPSEDHDGEPAQPHRNKSADA